MNLILYKSEPGILAKIHAANRVADYAAAHGIPARSTSDPRIIQLRAGERLKYGSLYQYLAGDTIPWEAYTQAHLKLLGAMLGRLHSVLRTTPQPPANHAADEYGAIVRRMEHYFAQRVTAAAIGRKLRVRVGDQLFGQYSRVLRATKQLSDQQPLHMDFVRGNILFRPTSEGPVISGVLDFEKTAYGHPLFDIARTLAFLLVDCKYKPEHKIRKYFLQSGYVKRGGNTVETITLSDIAIPNTSLLEILVDIFLLYDFYKFLRHNPYEFLAQNEHFMRTKQILINRNIIRAL